MKYRFLLVIATATIVGLLPNVAGAISFFTEDFESYALDAEVSTVGGWTISHTAATVETEADFHLVDTKNTAFAFGLPDFFNFGPATIGGTTTPPWDPTGTAPGGLFMFSLSGGIPPALMPTFLEGTTPADPDLPDHDAYNSRINNGSYTGASHDMISPSFSTVGATGDVWLHASVSSQLGDGATAIFDIDVSTDGGVNWVNHFRRISPGAGRNFATADFDTDLDVDGADFLTQQRLANFADCTNCNGTDPQNDHDLDQYRRNSDQRFSDWTRSFGPYTPVVATIGATLGDGDAGGTHGELDLNLGAALGGEADVKIRFRHLEQSDDEAIAIDNVRVDEVVPAGSESNTIYSEDFNTMTLGSMGVYHFAHPFSFFNPSDSGGGSGTLSGFSWGAQDRNSAEFPTGRYNAGAVGPKGVNHLGHPAAEGASGQVPFAIIDPKAEEDDMDPSPDNTQAERLHTPLLDLSGHTTVILEWDDEIIFDGNPILGSIQSVVLMEDTDGSAGPSDGDTIIAEPDKLATDFTNPYLPYDIFGGGIGTDDDSSFAHRRIDFSSLVAMATDKTKLYFAWQFYEQDTDYWAIDNILITGDGVAPLAAAGVVPEPSSLLLALLGIPAFAAARRRVRARQ